MTSIQLRFTSNCGTRVLSKSNRVRTTTPTASVTRLVTSAVSLCSSSFAFGMSAMTATPTSGRNTASVSAQSSNVFMGSLLPLGEDEGEREHADGPEHEGRVLLHATGLDVTEEAA